MWGQGFEPGSFLRNSLVVAWSDELFWRYLFCLLGGFSQMLEAEMFILALDV